MTAFDDALAVERRGRERLKPWLDDNAHAGRWTWIKGTSLELLLQKVAGDALVATGTFDSLVLEMKFLATSRDAPFEVWSNRVTSPDGESVDHALSTPGWGFTCKADLIGVYCLSEDKGVIGSLARWRAFLFERQPNGLTRARMRQQFKQGRRAQMNLTTGVWTAYADLVRHCGFVEFSAQQLELLDRDRPFGDRSVAA